MSYCHMSVHSTQSRSCTRCNCPINTGAVCDNLLIACQIQINSDKLEILVPCHLCNAHAILNIALHYSTMCRPSFVRPAVSRFEPRISIRLETCCYKLTSCYAPVLLTFYLFSCCWCQSPVSWHGWSAWVIMLYPRNMQKCTCPENPRDITEYRRYA